MQHWRSLRAKTGFARIGASGGCPALAHFRETMLLPTKNLDVGLWRKLLLLSPNLLHQRFRGASIGSLGGRFSLVFLRGLYDLFLERRVFFPQSTSPTPALSAGSCLPSRHLAAAHRSRSPSPPKTQPARPSTRAARNKVQKASEARPDLLLVASCLLFPIANSLPNHPVPPVGPNIRAPSVSNILSQRPSPPTSSNFHLCVDHQSKRRSRRCALLLHFRARIPSISI